MELSIHTYIPTYLHIYSASGPREGLFESQIYFVTKTIIAVTIIVSVYVGRWVASAVGVIPAID